MTVLLIEGSCRTRPFSAATAAPLVLNPALVAVAAPLAPAAGHRPATGARVRQSSAMAMLAGDTELRALAMAPRPHLGPV